MNRWWRLLRHRWMDRHDSARAVPDDMAERLARRVTASEARHTGEVRLVVEAALPNSYLLLAEHAIEFVADRALARQVPPETWQAIVDRLGTQLRAGGFEDGLTQALEEVSALLVAHFPSDGATPGENELPDTVLRV